MAEFPNILPDEADRDIRARLLERRAGLAAIPDLHRRRDYRTLLEEVDSALERLDSGEAELISASETRARVLARLREIRGE